MLWFVLSIGHISCIFARHLFEKQKRLFGVRRQNFSNVLIIQNMNGTSFVQKLPGQTMNFLDSLTNDFMLTYCQR